MCYLPYNLEILSLILFRSEFHYYNHHHYHHPLSTPRNITHFITLKSIKKLFNLNLIKSKLV